MIVFNIDSAAYICDMLKNKSEKPNISIFFNDGLQLQQVTGFNNIEEYFDVNGMTQTVITGYKILLNEGNELTIKLDGTKKIELCHSQVKPLRNLILVLATRYQNICFKRYTYHLNA